MTSIPLIETPELLPEADEPAAGIPPLLSLVPQAGPPAFAALAFGAALLLLLVPPITLVATLTGVVFLAAVAFVTVLVLAGAILAVPVVLVRRLRGHPLPHFSLPVPHLGSVKVRRV
jgi:hypothetical protein